MIPLNDFFIVLMMIPPFSLLLFVVFNATKTTWGISIPFLLLGAMLYYMFNVNQNSRNWFTFIHPEEIIPSHRFMEDTNDLNSEYREGQEGDMSNGANFSSCRQVGSLDYEKLYGEGRRQGQYRPVDDLEDDVGNNGEKNDEFFAPESDVYIVSRENADQYNGSIN